MRTNEIKIESGEKREFSTGAESQASSGKGTPVLVPGDAIIEIAKHFEKGAAIYGARNWEKGIPLSEQLNSLERQTPFLSHLFPCHILFHRITITIKQTN